MADSKITALGSIGTGTDPANDQLVIVDVSDVLPTGMATTGTTKRVSLNNLLASSPTATLASATVTGAATVGTTLGVTGDLTVDTNVLKVDTTLNRVGIGTASPLYTLDVRGNIAGGNGTIFGGITFSSRAEIGALSNHDVGFIANSVTQYLIAVGGTHTWFNGGTTAMTLNSTGLGVGIAATAAKLEIGGGDGTQFYIRSTGTNSARIRGFTNSTEAGLISFLNGGGISFDVSGEKARIDASGNLLVGATAQTSNEMLRVNTVTSTRWAVAMTSVNRGWLNRQSDASGGIAALFEVGATNVGSITTTAVATAYNIASDYRLKESVQPLAGGLARISALKPSIYKWKVNGSNGEGFLAHELADVVPAAVTGEKDAVDADGKPTYQGVDLSKIVPLLVAAIQELTTRVQTLEAR